MDRSALSQERLNGTMIDKWSEISVGLSMIVEYLTLLVNIILSLKKGITGDAGWFKHCRESCSAP